MTACISTIYIKSYTELLWSTRPGAVCDKKQKEEKDVTNRTCVVCVENNTNYHDRLDQVSVVIKTRLENYVTDHIDVVYAKKKIYVMANWTRHGV